MIDSFYVTHTTLRLIIVSISAMRVHISDSTKIALDELGGYIVQLRGEMPIKVNIYTRLLPLNVWHREMDDKK
jgi:hypothetical protein